MTLLWEFQQRNEKEDIKEKSMSSDCTRDLQCGDISVLCAQKPEEEENTDTKEDKPQHVNKKRKGNDKGALGTSVACTPQLIA